MGLVYRRMSFNVGNDTSAPIIGRITSVVQMQLQTTSLELHVGIFKDQGTRTT